MNAFDPSGHAASLAETEGEEALDAEEGMVVSKIFKNVVWGMTKGALTGAFVGFHLGFIDAITHGIRDPNEILNYMIRGAIQGATIGGIYGAFGALPGLLSTALQGFLTGFLLGQGAAGVGKSFGEGHYLGGTFRLLLLALGLRFGADDLWAPETQLHHSDPKFLGGDPKQLLTELLTQEHQQLHRDLNDFLRTQTDEFGNHMRPQRGNPGTRIRENFTRDQRLDSLSKFYRQYSSKYPEAAKDFFDRHPELK